MASAVHTLSPDIYTGYEKNKKALASKAGLKTLYPVPPKISLPITTPKNVATATIHNGMVGGDIEELKNLSPKSLR